MRLDQVRVARPYAHALSSVAGSPEALNVWSTHLEYLAEIIRHPEVEVFLKNPLNSQSDKKELLKSAWIKFSNDLPKDQADRLVDLLTNNRRLFILPELISTLDKLRDQYQGRHKAIVEGAFPLDAKDENVIQLWLEAQLGKKVYIEYHVNPELISGFRAKVGDECIYASIEHLLQRLNETLRRD